MQQSFVETSGSHLCFQKPHLLGTKKPNLFRRLDEGFCTPRLLQVIDELILLVLVLNSNCLDAFDLRESSGGGPSQARLLEMQRPLTSGSDRRGESQCRDCLIVVVLSCCSVKRYDCIEQLHSVQMRVAGG